MQLSSANVIEAVKTYRTVESTSKLVKRDVPGRVVFTAYAPKTKIAKHIKKEVKAVKLPTMKTKLHRLVAFQELSYGEIPHTGTAAAQAQLLVQEMVLSFMDEPLPDGVTVSFKEDFADHKTAKKAPAEPIANFPLKMRESLRTQLA